MQRPDSLLQFGVTRGRGLDQQRHLGIFLDRVVPAIDGPDSRQHVDAGSQPLLDQCAGQRLRAGGVGQVGHDEQCLFHGMPLENLLWPT